MRRERRKSERFGRGEPGRSDAPNAGCLRCSPPVLSMLVHVGSMRTRVRDPHPLSSAT